MLINHAILGTGATYSASSTGAGGYSAAQAFNGLRHTANNYGANAGWQSVAPTMTANAPEYLNVALPSPKGVSQFRVSTLGNAPLNYGEERLTETFSAFGLQDFKLRYKNPQGVWATAAGSVVANNNLVERTVVLTNPIVATEWQLECTKSSDGYARVLEFALFGEGAPVIVDNDLPDAIVGQAYEAVVDVSGGAKPFKNCSISGQPNGILCLPNEPALYGITSEYATSGVYPVTVTIIDAFDQVATKVLSLTVAAGQGGTILLEPFPIDNFQPGVGAGSIGLAKAELRFSANTDFIDGRGKFVAGRTRAHEWFEDSPVRLSPHAAKKGFIAQTSTVSIPATTNAQPAGEAVGGVPTISCDLYVDNRLVKKVFTDCQIPDPSLFNKNTITLFEILAFNRLRITKPSLADELRKSVVGLLGSVTRPLASILTAGLVALSVAPANPLNPIAVADNDPRVGVNASRYANFKAALDDVVAVAAGKPTVLTIVSNLPLGTFAGDTLEIPANVNLVFIAGGSINVPAGKRLTIKGNLTAGFDRIFTGDGVVDLRDAKISAAHPQWWGNDARALEQAAFSFGNQGGTLDFGHGATIIAERTVDWKNLNGVTFLGHSPSLENQPTISYTGGDAPRAFDMRSSAGNNVQSCFIEYTDEAFTGIMVDQDHHPVGAFASDTSRNGFFDSVLRGAGHEIEGVYLGHEGYKSAALITFDYAIICRMERCHLYGARAGVRGVKDGNPYSNSHTFTDNTINRCFTSFLNPGSDYRIVSNTIEPFLQGRHRAIECLAGGYLPHGLVVEHNYMGDLFGQVEPLCIFRGSSVAFRNNWLPYEGNFGGTAIVFDNCDGVHIFGNDGGGTATMVEFTGGCARVIAGGNRFIPNAYQPPDVLLNFAASRNGGTVTASSSLDARFLPANLINENRTFTTPTWRDGTIWFSEAGAPQTLTFAFSQPRTVTKITLVTVRDNIADKSPVTETETFAEFGVTDYQVEYKSGANWLPAGTVANNNKVLSTCAVNFTAQEFRIIITGAAGDFVIATEVEATGTIMAPPPVIPARNYKITGTLNDYYISDWEGADTNLDLRPHRFGGGGRWFGDVDINGRFVVAGERAVIVCEVSPGVFRRLQFNPDSTVTHVAA